MHRHPIAYERVIGYAAGDLHGEDAAAVAAHMEICPECAAVVARYCAVRQVLVADLRVTPPPGTNEAVLALFTRFGPPSAAIEPRRLIARLTHGFCGGFALGGVRSVAGPYRALYENDEVRGEVDLQIEPLPGDGEPRWQILGQVALEALPAATPVALVRVGQATPEVETEAGSDGVFAIEVRSGHYELRIRLPSTLLVVTDVEVG